MLCCSLPWVRGCNHGHYDLCMLVGSAGSSFTRCNMTCVFVIAAGMSAVTLLCSVLLVPPASYVGAVLRAKFLCQAVPKSLVCTAVELMFSCLMVYAPLQREIYLDVYVLLMRPCLSDLVVFCWHCLGFHRYLWWDFLIMFVTGPERHFCPLGIEYIIISPPCLASCRRCT